jgi:hypothetical protein
MTIISELFTIFVNRQGSYGLGVNPCKMRLFDKYVLNMYGAVVLPYRFFNKNMTLPLGSSNPGGNEQ